MLIKRCTEKLTGREYLLRVINKAKIFGSDDMIHAEVEVMKMLNHDNIMKVADDWETTDHIYLLMEDIKVRDKTSV